MSKLDDALASLEAQATANTDAEASAVVVLNKIPQMIADAVAAALAAGATAAELQSITDLQAKLAASAASLGAAVVANTPAA